MEWFGINPRRHRKRLLGALLLSTSAVVLAACSSSGSPGSSAGANAASGTATAGASASGSGNGNTGSSAPAGKGKYTIALSNSYIGNGWRKSMVSAWTAAAEADKKAGLIKDYRVENTAQNTATAQIAQIQSLILAHVDAITIDSASPTALNPVIEKACAAGIKVVVFDSLASAPCEYNLADPFEQWGLAQVQLVINQMNGKGNLIVVQGVVGSAPNDTVMKVWKQELAKYPDIKVVATVDGENASSTTQNAIAAVLPSLPKVDGVLVQVGADGVIQAFKAANRPLPAVDFDTSGASLKLWSDLHQQSGFTTSAVLTDPGQGSAALQEAIMLLEGGKVNGQPIPKNLEWPLVIIKQADFDPWFKATPTTAVAGWTWTYDQVKAGIEAQQNKKPVDPLPPPSS